MQEIILQYSVPALAVVLAFLVALLERGFSYIKKRWKLSDEESEALDILFEGVVHAQEEFAIVQKLAASDGKLTSIERQQARDMAYDYAISIAKGPAKEFLLRIGRNRADVYVKEFLKRISK